MHNQLLGYSNCTGKLKDHHQLGFFEWVMLGKQPKALGYLKQAKF
jgi:hypothetical protein